MSEKLAVKSQQLVLWSHGPSLRSPMVMGDNGHEKKGNGKRGKGQGTKCCPAVGDGDTGSINRLAGGMGHFVVGCGCGIECGL